MPGNYKKHTDRSRDMGEGSKTHVKTRDLVWREGIATVKLWALLPFGNLISGVIFRAVGSGQVYGFSNLFFFSTWLPVIHFHLPFPWIRFLGWSGPVFRDFGKAFFQLQGLLFT